MVGNDAFSPTLARPGFQPPRTLAVEDKPFKSGLSAYATCPNGHRKEHPLIYPSVIRVIAEKDGADARAISEALTAIGWWPHLCHWRDLEDPEHTLFLDYRPWDDSLAGIMECHYPDLVAAFRHG
jgi:hypothetical protein